MLIKRGANENLRNHKGDMLIKRGANENLRNHKGFNPWQCLDSTVSII